MSRFQWVFRNECGCPFGVMSDGGHTPGEAWKAFFDEGTPARTTKAIGAAVARGATAVKVPHGEYVAEFMPKMRPEYRCPHGTGPALQPCTTLSRLKRHLSRDLSTPTFSAGGRGATLCGREAVDEREAARVSGRNVSIALLPECRRCANQALNAGTS